MFLSSFASLSSRPVSRSYYQRKRQQGKRHNQAVLALPHRRILTLHATIHNGHPLQPPNQPRNYPPPLDTPHRGTPRDRRGVRHSLFTVLSLAVTGVLAGCRSLTAIWEHTTDLTPSDLRSLGLEAGQALPSESTIRRVLQDLDPTDLNTRLRSWFCTRTGTVEGRTVIAMDGKTVRGARLGQASAPHLLSALDHATGAVLTQARVADKSIQRSPPSESFSSPSTSTG